MDNLSTRWTREIRAWAAASNLQVVPTPTDASFLNRIECHFRAIGEFTIKNTDYPDWDTWPKRWPTTSACATASTAAARSPRSKPAPRRMIKLLCRTTKTRDPLGAPSGNG